MDLVGSGKKKQLVIMEFCERIEHNDLDEKSLSKKLDEKILYNFHNITTPTILDAPSMELAERLTYKSEQKLNDKTITTKANLLITSTCNYLPLIGGGMQSMVVDVESKIYKFCKEQNINSSPYVVAKLIKNDLENFISIVRSIDMFKLNNPCNLNFSYNNAIIVDGKEDPLKAFDIFIRIRHIDLFINLKITNPDLYYILDKDFKEGRIARPNLIKYFESVFGKNIYKNNAGLIEALKILSDDKHPFDNEKTFQIKKIVYYSL